MYDSCTNEIFKFFAWLVLMQSTTLLQQLRELVNNLVKVHPKAPCGYQDYLLVTRNYLLANQLSFATYVKRVSFLIIFCIVF